jgi:hypothetical protein
VASPTVTVTEVARGAGVSPRTISDLFYARKLDDAKCPVVSGRRRIPVEYVEEIKRVINEEKAKRQQRNGPGSDGCTTVGDLFAGDGQ